MSDRSTTRRGRDATRRLAALLALLALIAAPASRAQSQAITTGPGTDYQPSVVRAQDGALVVVFERLVGPSLSGDLWLTRSTDDGATWSSPAMIIGSSQNERHPALLQRSDGSFLLFYLRSTTAGTYELVRATSSDGTAFVETGPLDLGWTTGSEINPHVVQHADGSLTMSYQRLPGGSHVARSTDAGLTWDTLRTAIATDGLLPRVTYRESDARWFATYQVNPGTNQLALYAKTTTDVHDWTAPATPLATDGDNHDSLPVVMPDDALAVFFIHANGAQYDLYSRRAGTALEFEPAIAQVRSAGADDVEPHPLVVDARHVWLYWGRGAPAGSLDYDIHREFHGITDTIGGDGFED